MSENLSYLAGRSGLKGTVEEAVTKAPFIGKASAYGAKSFYDFIAPESESKKVFICSGTACKIAGTQGLLKEKLLKKYSEDEIGEACCLGLCYKNAAYHENGKNLSLMESSPSEVLRDLEELGTQEGLGNREDPKKQKIPKDLKGPMGSKNIGSSEVYSKSQLKTPMLVSSPLPLDQITEALKAVLARPSEEVLSEIQVSGLRGRGGAGFPVGLKLKSCAVEKSKRKYVVCNADEGDPGSYSDAYLLEYRPELVLFGIIVSAYLVGAQEGILYIRAEYPDSLKVINESIGHWERQGLVGKNILGSSFDFEFKTIRAAGSYVCGEETALLSSIEGQRPEVRIRPPFPTTQGLYNQPTVVNNVESLAYFYEIMINGGEKFSQMGTSKSTGPKLVSLNSFFRRPGVYEVEMGTPLKSIVEDLGHSFTTEVKALQVGGPLGGVVPMDQIKDLTLDFESFSEKGFLLGHGNIMAIPKSFPMIDYMAHLMEFTKDESCGKCVPCRIGAQRGFEMLNQAGENKVDVELFRDLLETMELGSLCALGGGVPLPVRNILQYFSSELKEHFRGEL